MGFGKNLSQILKEKNISVYSLSKETNIPSTTIHAIIKRDSNNVNIDTIQKIADFLELTVDELVGWNPEKTPAENIENSPIAANLIADTFKRKLEGKEFQAMFSTEEYSPDELLKIKEFADYLKHSRKK